jgi:hypothetical protein
MCKYAMSGNNSSAALYVCVCIHILHRYIHIHAFVHTYIRTHIHTYINTYIHTRARTQSEFFALCVSDLHGSIARRIQDYIILI